MYIYVAGFGWFAKMFSCVGFMVSLKFSQVSVLTFSIFFLNFWWLSFNFLGKFLSLISLFNMFMFQLVMDLLFCGLLGVGQSGR